MKSTVAQKGAIVSTAEKILVLAGPGSGKTATTVERIGHLIATGVNPREILALTFTNAAARELESRVKRLQFHANGDESMPPQSPGRLGFVGTLHGFGLKMLKKHGEPFGYGSRLSIIGEQTADELLVSVAKRLKCVTGLEQLKKTRSRLAPIIPRPTLDETVVREFLGKLREAGMVDFDLILSEFYRLLQVEDFFAAVLGEGFKHLFVDEFQDSAEIDAKIYARLPIPNRFFVGDPDQAIYSFRGGRIDSIITMEKDPGVEVHRLEENFRSRTEICTAAQRMIERNTTRAQKRTVSTRGTGGKFYIMAQAANEDEEGATLRGLVSEELAEFGTVAILTRTNAIAGKLRDLLRRSGVPIVEKKFTRLPADWRTVIRYVELLTNPNNPTLRFLYMREKYGETVAEEERRKEEKAGPDGFVHGFPRVTLASDMPALLAKQKFTRESLMLVAERLEKLEFDAGLGELAVVLNERDDDEPAEALVGVTVTTMHGAKGREFDIVFLPAFEEGLLPIRQASGAQAIEEERRLAYVAVTRAKEKCYISSAAMRTTPWGKVQACQISRFAREAQPLPVNKP